MAVDGHPMLSLTGFTAALYQHPLDQVLKIDVLRGTRKLSFNVPAVPARDRMAQLAGIADPIKSHIGRLAILGLDINDELRSLLPDVRIGSGVIVLGRAPGLQFRQHRPAGGRRDPLAESHTHRIRRATEVSGG